MEDANTTDSGHATRAGGEVAAHIMRVAAHLFASRGYDATSVREIVEAAGVTKPTLYYHFGSKQGLAEEMLRRPHVELVGHLRDLIEREADPVRLLRETLETHLRFCRDDPDRARFFFAILSSPQNETLAAEMCRHGDPMERAMTDCFARLADLGLVEAARIDALRRTFRGLIFVSILEFLRFGRPLGPGLADELVRDLLCGFGRPGFPIEGA